MTTRVEILARLAGLLDSFSRYHRDHKRPCRLEPDAPAAVRELWEAVGYSPILGDLPPEREAGLQPLAKVFDEWFWQAESRDAWGVGEARGVPFDRLPARFRVVSDSVWGLALTDESAGADDPPVVEFSERHPEPKVEHPSYLRSTIVDLLYRAAGRRRVEASWLAELPGPRPLAPLFPELVQIGDGIYAVYQLKDGAHARFTFAVFGSYDGYFDFVAGLPDEHFRTFEAPPGHTFNFAVVPALDILKGALPELRLGPPTPGAPDRRWAVGRIDGIRAWLSQTKGLKWGQLTVHPEHRKHLRAWLKAHGAAIESETKPDGGNTGARGPYDWDYTQPDADARAWIASAPSARKAAARPVTKSGRATAGRPVTKPGRVRPQDRALRAEAERLRQLLEQLEPQFAATWRPIRLEPGAPTRARVFWETLGWSELLVSDLAEPLVASGRRAVRALLAQYRADSDRFRLTLKDLPKRFRFLSADEQGVAFSITDESRRVPDPPVVAVIAEDGRIRRERPSYVRFAAAVALLFALRSWRQTPSRGKLPKGRQPFPLLIPEARELGEGRWLVPDPDGQELLLLVRGGPAPRRKK